MRCECVCASGRRQSHHNLRRSGSTKVHLLLFLIHWFCRSCFITLRAQLCIPTKLLHLLVHRAVFLSDGRVAPADSRHNIRRVQSWEWWLWSIMKQAALKTASFWAANDSGSHSVWHLKIKFAWSCLLRWVSAYRSHLHVSWHKNPKGWAYINWFKLEQPI